MRAKSACAAAPRMPRRFKPCGQTTIQSETKAAIPVLQDLATRQKLNVMAILATGLPGAAPVAMAEPYVVRAAAWPTEVSESHAAIRHAESRNCIKVTTSSSPRDEHGPRATGAHPVSRIELACHPSKELMSRPGEPSAANVGRTQTMPCFPPAAARSSLGGSPGSQVTDSLRHRP